MKKAFTLIELLVVIAIIAILAAILFPVFARAKNAAKGAVCISNMRQIGIASLLYVSDSDDQYFPALKYDPLPGFAPQRPWVGYDNLNTDAEIGGYWGDVSQPAKHPVRPGCIDPYLKTLEIIKCPNKPAGSQTALALSGFDTVHPSDFYTAHPEVKGQEYGPSMAAGSYIDGTLDYVGVNDSSIDEPSETLLAWEHKASAPICNFLQPFDWETSPPNLQILLDHFNFLHTDGTNTIWTDGHAKRLVYGQLRRRYFSVRKDLF